MSSNHSLHCVPCQFAPSLMSSNHSLHCVPCQFFPNTFRNTTPSVVDSRLSNRCTRFSDIFVRDSFSFLYLFSSNILLLFRCLLVRNFLLRNYSPSRILPLQLEYWNNNLTYNMVFRYSVVYQIQ